MEANGVRGLGPPHLTTNTGSQHKTARRCYDTIRSLLSRLRFGVTRRGAKDTRVPRGCHVRFNYHPGATGNAQHTAIFGSRNGTIFVNTRHYRRRPVGSTSHDNDFYNKIGTAPHLHNITVHIVKLTLPRTQKILNYNDEAFVKPRGCSFALQLTQCPVKAFSKQPGIVQNSGHILAGTYSVGHIQLSTLYPCINQRTRQHR